MLIWEGREVRLATKKQEEIPVDPPADPPADPDDPQAALTETFKKLDQVIKSLPKEKVEAAKKEVEELLKGDLSWMDILHAPPEKLWQMAELGYNHFKNGRYDKSEIIFKGLTVIDPDNYYYHQMLGATYQRQDKFPEAVLEYSMAVDLNAKDSVSLTNRGEVYFKIGIYELAEKDFNQSISLDTKGDDRWANRARMLKKQVEMIRKKGK